MICWGSGRQCDNISLKAAPSDESSRASVSDLKPQFRSIDPRQMISADISITAFEPCHLEGACALSQQVSWPHRMEDWQLVLELSRGVVALENGSRVVGTALATCYSDDCATVNMIIVDETLRSRGLGRKLMGEVLTMAADRPLRLIATREGVPLYETFGFRQTGIVIQHQGMVSELNAPENVSFEVGPDLEEISDFDKRAFGADRSNMLSRLASVGRFAFLRREGEVAGFAGLREFGRGEVIGPVVASDQADAEALIRFCIASRPNKFLRVDTTEVAAISDWLVDLGLENVGGGIQMSKGKLASQSIAAVQTFALANQALG